MLVLWWKNMNSSIFFVDGLTAPLFAGVSLGEHKIFGGGYLIESHKCKSCANGAWFTIKQLVFHARLWQQGTRAECLKAMLPNILQAKLKCLSKFMTETRQQAWSVLVCLTRSAPFWPVSINVASRSEFSKYFYIHGIDLIFLISKSSERVIFKQTSVSYVCCTFSTLEPAPIKDLWPNCFFLAIFVDSIFAVHCLK